MISKLSLSLLQLSFLFSLFATHMTNGEAEEESRSSGREKGDEKRDREYTEAVHASTQSKSGVSSAAAAAAAETRLRRRQRLSSSNSSAPKTSRGKTEKKS